MWSFDRRWLVAGLSAILTLGCSGADGKQGSEGAPGQQGDAGVVPPLVNDVTGTVTDGTHALAGVSVTAPPGTATATTDAQGAFSLKALPLGAYELTFHLTGYVDQTITAAVSLSGPTTLSVVLAINPDGGAPFSVSISDQLTAGYATPVTIKATAAGNGPFTYAWTQTNGPTATLTGATTDTLSFTTQDLATSLGPNVLANARFDVLGIDPDQALDYAFQVVVTDAHGLATTSTVHVNATRPTLGLRMAPLGIPVWLQGNGPLFPLPPVPPATTGAPQTTWSWTLDTSAVPASKATLSGASTQFPSFVPDVVGTYKVTETVSGQTMSIYGGTWQGEMTDAAQSVCLMCHGSGTNIAPDIFPLWKGTAHYSALQHKIEGSAGQDFTEACLSCHTVGYDETAQNGGFDDVEQTSGWTYPAKDQPGNWAALLSTPNLGQLAGIQCENCHGPQAGGMTGPHANATNLDIGARISFSVSVCASCHQEAPNHYKPSQWALGKHADRSLALSEGTVENSPVPAHCGRCHSAQGFKQYAMGLNAGYYAYLTNDGKPLDTSPTPSNHVATTADMQSFGMTKATVESQTCAACHDPHDATNPSQIRISDSIAALPNGLTNLSGLGSGALCVACHNSRNGEHTDLATQAAGSNGILGPGSLTSFSGPHAAAQSDVMFGFNAYFGNRLNPSAHLAVADTCAGCHHAITTASEAAAQQTSNHSFVVDNTICASCHSSNVDGAGLEAANKARLDGLRSLLASKTLAPIAAALNAAPGATLVARAYDPVTGYYSSSSKLNVVVSSVPTQVDYTPIGTTIYGGAASMGITLHLPTPVSVQWVDANGNNVGTPVSVSSLTVPLSSLKLPPPASGTQLTPFNAPTANAANVQVLYKAYWNMVLLNNDNTFGIHNPAFFAQVVGATSSRLEALP